MKLELEGLERFEVRRQIGTGGMGVVYEAYDRERKTRVALKTLRHLDAQALYRFKAEFRALQGIQHRNLARLDELIEHEGEWFYSMEYIDGVDILTHVKPPGAADAGKDSSGNIAFDPTDPSGVPKGLLVYADTQKFSARAWKPEPSKRSAKEIYDEGRLRSAMRQLAEAIDALHRAGKVHRDIKPSNVLVSRDGRVVLIDFGLVSDITESSGSSSQRVAGTAAYMAPEQALAKATPASDWYSFGLILYEALVGSKAYRGKVLEVLMDKQQFAPPDPRMIVGDAAADLCALCSELVSVDPKARPTASRVLARLGAETSASDASPSTFSTNAPPSQSVPFVGRERELSELMEAFEDSRDAGPVLTFLHGASGVGKSELARRFGHQLAQDHPDAVVLSGRCYERESVPYKAFDGIADRLSRYMNLLDPVAATELLPLRAGLLPQLFPILRRVEAIATAPPPRVENLDPQELRTRMFWAFRELLQKLTYRHPLVLVIDDFQFSDADSLNLLGELVQEPDAPRLLLIATMRTRSGLQPLLAEMKRVAGVEVRHKRLGRLPPEDATLLTSLLLPGMDERHPDIVQRIASEADGHPLFIQELSRHVDPSQPHASDVTRLHDALWARIVKLPPAARRVLELLAVAGTPITQETLAYAALIPPPELASVVGLLRVAFLARTSGARDSDTIELYHDRVRDAVMFRTAPEQLAHLHGRLAIALDRSGAAEKDPNSLVRHLEAAGHRERAARYAIEGARRAEDALAFDRAVDLYRAAVRLAPAHAQERTDLQMSLGRALINAGRGQEGADVLLAAAEDADPETRIVCERQAAEQLLISGHLERGMEVVHKLLAEIGDRLPKTPWRALASLLWNRFRLRLRGARWRERSEREIPASQLLRIDVYASVAAGLTMVDSIRGADFQARALRLTLRAGEPARIGRALALEAGFLATLGARGRRRARALLAEASGIAEARDDAYLAAWARSTEGAVDYFSGRFTTAQATLSEAEQLLIERTSGTAWEIGTTRVFQTFVLRHEGALRELRAVSAPFLRDARRRGDRYAEATMRKVLAHVLLAEDEPEQVRAELAAVSWPVPEHGGFHLQHWYELEAVGELSLYEGTVAEELELLAPRFEALRRSQLLRVQVVRGVSRWLLARLLLAAAAVADDPRRLRKRARRIAIELSKESVPYANVWSLLLRAALAAQQGRIAQATENLRQAALGADDAGMLGCAAAARFRHAQLVGGNAGDMLRKRSDAWIAHEEVANPRRYFETIAPGFPGD